MKSLSALMVATTFLLGACQSTTDATMTEKAPASPIAPLMEKKLVAESGATFTHHANGTVSGEIGGEAVVGAYVTNGSETCSTYTAPNVLAGKEFCSVPKITGDTVVFHRRDGSTSQVYKIDG